MTNKKNILKNSIYLYLRMAILLAITLFTSREVLKYLGITDYGIYNVVAGFVSFVSFFNNTLLSATQRFFNYCLGDDKTKLNDVFKASLFTHLALSIIVIVIMESFGYYFFYNELNIPADRMNAAIWTFHISIIISCLTIIRSPYNALIIAHEKMDVFTYFTIFEGISKLLIVYLLAQNFMDKLVLYSIFLLFIQIVLTISYYYYSKKRFQTLKFNFKIKKEILKDIMKFIGWSSYGGISMLGYTQGINILLNIFLGPTVNAARGIAVQIESMIKQFKNNFQVAINPQLTQNCAEGNYCNFYSLLAFGCKFSTLIMTFIILPILFRIDWLLELWLVEVPPYTTSFLKIILLTCLVDSTVGPFVTGIQANGNIKKHELIGGTLQLIILPLSYWVLKNGYPPTSVYWICLLILIITQAIRIKLFCNIFGVSYSHIIKIVYKDIGNVIVVSLIIGYILDISISRTLLGNISFYIIYIICILYISFVLGLNKKEKIGVNKYILQIINKIKK